MDAIERRTRTRREAAQWWALLQGDEMTRAQREDFIDWLRDSQSHVAEMLRLAQVHGALEQFRGWALIDTERPAAEDRANVISLRAASDHELRLPDDSAREPKRSPRGMKLFAAAAMLAVAAILITVFVPHLRGQSIVTERGERRELVLDDGSVVKVDPQSRLRVQFEPDLRRVRLMEGRAVFRVAKDPSRPFLVDAKNATVRAVGTSFGVEQRERDVVVTVSEGTVAVTPLHVSHLSGENRDTQKLIGEQAEAGGDGPRRVEAGAVFLSANEQVTVAGMGTIRAVRSVQSERELAWAEGRLVFRNDPIARVVAEFNRYNRVQLTVSDQTLAARPVTGVFDAANPEAFIAFLQNAAAVRVTRDDGRAIAIEPAGLEPSGLESGVAH